MKNPIKRFWNYITTKASAVSSAAFSSLGSASWFSRDYANFAKEAYIENYVAFRCIDLIAQSVASVPWKVFKRDDENREELPDHPLMRILHRANPNTSWSEHQLGVTSFLVLDGNSYIEKIAPETGPNKGIPLEVHYHRPDQIKPILDSDTQVLIGWKLEINGKIVKEWLINPITLQCDLLQMKKFHPLDDIFGLSPVEPGAKSIDTSNQALTWNKSLLENDARPGTMFIFDSALGDDQFKRLQKQLAKRFSGAENTGNNLIVEGQMKDARPFGFNPKEMDFLKGNWDLARQVCMVFGVPPQLLGIPGDSTFANFEQARQYFWETTVFFYLMYERDEYNNWFFPEDDKTFIDYILDDVPALALRRQEKRDAIEKSTFMTIDEKREAMGMETISGGDVLLVPANMVPLDMVGITEEEVDDSESDMDDLDIEDEEDDGTDDELEADKPSLELKTA